VVALHNGEQIRGLPGRQFADPAASNAYTFESFDPTNTIPFATAGDDTTAAPVAAVHNGEHTFGGPATQLLLPAASNAYTFPSFDPTNTVPFATVGEESVTGWPRPALHSGVHVFGGPPLQFVFPAASNAYKFPSLDPA
jgi:hypothetical protein